MNLVREQDGMFSPEHILATNTPPYDVSYLVESLFLPLLVHFPVVVQT